MSANLGSESLPPLLQDANIASRLRAVAAVQPGRIATARALGRFQPGIHREYATLTFADLELQTSSIAAGLQELGILPGMRIVMLVKFGVDFVALVFALLKVGAVVVLIDPGMGRKNLLKCLEATNPDGFVAIPAAQAIRMALKHRFPSAKFNVTVGKRFGFLPKPTLEQLAGTPSAMYEPPKVELQSPAAIIFTTGSTGPPKGVLYTQRTFNSQVDQLVTHYGIEPGGFDLSGFPLFGLFNAVMGTTTVFPDMEPTRPADVDPPRLLDAIDQWKINQAFGSPALWTAIGRYTEQTGRRIASLERVFSAGAPVPPKVLQRMRAALPEHCDMFTPYGATEALPIASIESREILEETSLMTTQGAGTCVGRKFSGIDWKIIAIDDGPLPTMGCVRELPVGQIGELMVRGDVVTEQYVTRSDQNALHKVKQSLAGAQDVHWHRMGDVGYLDELGRFWCCGRKSQRVRTKETVLFTEPCEAIFNTHQAVHRSALIGLGPVDQQEPVIIAESWPEHAPASETDKTALIAELQQLGRSHDHTKAIEQVLIYPSRLPTDIRHNSKIFREQLVPWAEKQLPKRW